MSHRSFPTVLSLALALVLVPACGGGGGGGQGPSGPDASTSSLVLGNTFGTPADGLSAVSVQLRLADGKGRPLEAVPVALRASGFGNVLVQPAATDADGRAAGRLTSTAAERKDVRAVVYPGTPQERELLAAATEFVEVPPRTFYVRGSSPTASDAAGGTSPIDAWRTLGHALTRIGAGDTLVLGAGLYEPVTIELAGTAQEPVVLRGDPTGLLAGDAGPVVIDAGGGPFGLRFSGASHVLVRDLEIQNAWPALPARGGAVWFTPELHESISIVGCSIHGSARGIDVEAARDLVLESNRVSDNAGDGIDLNLTAGATVLHNLIYANGGAGVRLAGASADLSIGLNTFFQNGGDQVSETATGSTGLLSHNVAVQGGGDAFRFHPESELTASHNLAWANAGEEELPPPNAGVLIADPRLADPFGPDGVLGGAGAQDDDFRLLPGSSAFDAGDVPASQLLLPRGAPMSTRTSRPTGLRDGQAPDGSLVNLGYHYPGALEGFESLGAGAARVAWVLPGEVSLRTSVRGADGSFSPGRRVQDANSEAQWVVHRAAASRPEEYAAVLTDNGADVQLFVRRWNGRRWSEDADAPVPCAIARADVGERGFDLELEGLSGEALLVRSAGDSNPVWRAFSGGRWSADQPVFALSPGVGKVLWVDLVPEPGTNRIALLALTDLQNLVAAIWNGSAWTSATLLDDEIVSVRGFKAFDGAWESKSGELLVVWGFSSFAEQARYATHGAAGWQLGLHPSTEAVGAQVRLAADPTSDRIVAGFGEGDHDDDVSVAMWDGSKFVHTAEMTLQGVYRQQSIHVGWVGETGNAYALWRDQGQAGTFMRARFAGSWKIEGEIAPPGVGAAILIESYRVPGSDRTQVVFLDAGGALHEMELGWSGNATTWSLGNGGLPIAVGLDMMRRTRTFSVDVRRP